jgi:UDP-glucose 4-epimerase
MLEYQNVKVVVLGASGFIGRWVARLLCARNANVILFVRDRLAGQNVFSQYGISGEIIEADLRDPLIVRNTILNIRPSIIFNLAGYGIDPAERDKETAHQINAQLVNTVCEAMSGVRSAGWSGQGIVHVGSALEYGEIGGNLHEDSLPNPTTLYGQTKLAGTKNLGKCYEKFGIKGLTARLFTVYGPGEHAGRLLPSLLKAASNGSSLPLSSGEQKRDFTYVEDVAAGLLHLGLSTVKYGKIVNLATGRLTSVRNFVETAAKVLQIPAEKLIFGAFPTRPEEMQHDPVTIERLKGLTGWFPPTDISEGIYKTMVFMKQLYGGIRNEQQESGIGF